MSVEIERKFLVNCDDFIQEASHSKVIKQGYLSVDKMRTVRIRIAGDRGYITIKGISSADGLSRFEWERELSLSEANSLFELTLPGAILKERFYVELGKHTWEVDKFYGDNEGLLLAEIELGFETEEFSKPHFIGVEVTGDKRYYNSYLTQYPFKTWDNNK